MTKTSRLILSIPSGELVEVNSHVFHVQKEERFREFLLPRKKIFLSMLKRVEVLGDIATIFLRLIMSRLRTRKKCCQLTVE